MRIIIDGDGCPVKDETLKVADKYQIPVIIVTSFAHYTDKDYPYPVDFIYVDSQNQMADYKIYSILEEGDILLTQDYGLASMALEKAKVIHHSGMEYTVDNIDQLLAERYVNQKARMVKGRQSKNKPFNDEAKVFFENFLQNYLEEFI